jgi:hypothetical protein
VFITHGVPLGSATFGSKPPAGHLTSSGFQALLFMVPLAMVEPEETGKWWSNDDHQLEYCKVAHYWQPINLGMEVMLQKGGPSIWKSSRTEGSSALEGACNFSKAFGPSLSEMVSRDIGIA